MYVNIAWKLLSLYVLHCHLGHIHYGAIQDAIQKGHVNSLQIDPNDTEERFCEVCAAGKLTMKQFLKELFTCAKEFGERVHWDLWGPTSVKSLGGKSYTTVHKDDATWTVKPYFLAKKSKTFNLYKQDKAWILNHGGRPTSYTRFDCGGEFMSNEFYQHLKSKGTQHELTVHDSLSASVTFPNQPKVRFITSLINYWPFPICSPKNLPDFHHKNGPTNLDVMLTDRTPTSA